ncbi:MAG: LruC domain-containing protein [Bacteroidetes bacterium]|nr:MAG: LruC domain-containing protein [Bacteroidota bacterium]
MNRIKIMGLLCATLVLIASCKRDTPQTDSPSSTNASAVTIEAKDLVVPANFNFSSEKTLNVRVKVADAKAGERYVIKVYGDVPTTGKLISTGATNANGEYANTLQIPAWEEFIYIEKINPDGSSQFEKVKANQFAAAVFNGSQTKAPYIITKKSSGMNCSTGCTVTYNNPSSNITVDSGDVACITGTISGSIDLTVNKGGVAKVCASGNFYEVHTFDDGEVYFLENTILTVYSIITQGGKIINYSDSLTTTSDYDFYGGGIGENYGKVYGAGIKVLDGIYTNNGDIITANGPIFIWGSPVCKFINNNYVKAKGLYVTDKGVLENNCFFQSTVNSESNATIINNGYLKVDGIFTQVSWGPGQLIPSITLGNSAQITVDELQFIDGVIDGAGSTARSKIKVNSITNFGSGTTLKGNVDLCDANGLENNAGTLQTPALASCAGYIPTSTCNPEGFGSYSSADTDNDGVMDSQDEYPNDANRAFNSYYPSAVTTATLAFEDLWPTLADYDFNDLVLAFNIQQVYNADNKVVDIKIKMKVKAIGGSYVNGFGFQLDELVPADIASVTGQVLTQNLITRNANNTEAGQSKAVIICYDSPEPTLHRMGGSMFNTIKTNPLYASDSIYINIALSTPVEGSKLSIDKFNPFMFTNKRRGYEIHLGNFKPTDLANTSLFGTYVDRTNPSNNIYYKNSNGMPWAILIPENFVYPVEKTPITSGYNFFDDWAISGGSGYTNWYNNNPGNRNTNSLY